MGIHDRDYARPGSPNYGRAGRPWPAGGAFLRGLTVVHWLVILNVAIFMVDGLIGARNPVLTHMGTYLAPSATVDTVIDRSISVVDPGSGLQYFPIRERATGQVVGQWRYAPMQPLQSIGHFSTAKAFIGLEVWRFVTFQFLHGGVNHLLFNMIALWFFGPLVEQHLRSRRLFLAYYLICGIFGAALYLILNLAGYLVGIQKPLLLINDVYTPLIGASAGVFGVLMASAFIAGNSIMLLFFVLPLKVRTGAYLMFFFALLNLVMGGANAGGDAAHVGGAVAGFYFIRNSHLLTDFLSFRAAPKPGSGSKRKAGWFSRRRRDPEADRKRVDQLLDKISAHGLHSLTARERKFLQSQSDPRRDVR